MNRLIAGLLALLLGACSLGPAQKDTPATYDLGAPVGASANLPRIRASLLVQGVAAPGWLESQAIVYRLNYQDAARQQVYANSRWAAPPAELLAQRLRGQLAAASDGGILGLADSARADYALRVELEEFSQVFDAVAASRAVIVARASIVDVTRRVMHAQKTFTIEKPAASPNAEGGVRALAAASGELVDAIVAWSAASLAQDRK
jgi:cholesterol transport system auxiliary component